METRILQNQIPSPETQLGHLAESLRFMLATVKAGEWERFVEQADNLMPAMDAVKNAADLQKYDVAEHRQKIAAILSMLESAIQECSTRKDQLSPLIEALNRTSAHPTQP